MSYSPAVDERRESRSTNWNLLCFAGAVAAATFAIDVLTPRGFAAGVVPYFIFMLISLRLPGRAPFMFAALASALAMLGYLQSTGGEPWPVLADRALIVAGLWVAAVLIHLRQTEARALEAAPVAVAPAVPSAATLAEINNELRQPLQAAGLLAASLLEDTPDPARRQTVEEIARAVRRMGGLLDDLCGDAAVTASAPMIEADGPESTGVCADAPAATGLGGLAIALIEDDPLARKAMVGVLERWGATVIAAETGEQVLAELASVAALDAIVTDYRLPEQETGVGVVDRLRRRFGRRVPAMVITGDVVTAVRREVEAAGCMFVEKPVEPARLRRLIGELVDERPELG